MAELTLAVGYIVTWFTCMQTGTHPNNNRAQCMAAAL